MQQSVSNQSLTRSDVEPQADANVTTVVRFGDFELELTAPHDVCRSLDAYLGPYVDIGGTASCLAPVQVRCRADSTRMAVLLESFRKLVNREIRLHGNACGLRLDDGPGGSVVWNVGDNTICQFTSPGQSPVLEFVCESFSISSCLDLARIARGILVRGFECRGARKLHAACVSKGGVAILLVGPSGAGKTSFSLATLQARWADALISNDKTVVYNAAGGIRALGIPYAVSIGEGTLEHCRCLHSRTDCRVINGETYFWPQQVAASLGCGLLPSAPLAAIVRVELALDAASPQLNRISLSSVLDDMLHFSEEVHPTWLHELLGLDVPAVSTDVDLASTPIWKLTGNPWRMSFGDILVGIFGR